MSDITELERRLSAALDRIGRAADDLARAEMVPAAVQAQPADAGEAGDLREALEAERTANAQLTERVRAIKEKQESIVAGLERKVAQLTEQLDHSAQELARQKRTNQQLVEANRALSESASQGLAEPHLINRTMMAELEALRAARAAEIAEMDEILSELKPLIGEVA